MQGQQSSSAGTVPSAMAAEDDVLMNSPFTMDEHFSKPCNSSTNSTSMLADILRGDNCDDWNQMDCDDDEQPVPHRLVRGALGMASHDSTGSLDSASSSSSSTPEGEPELSQSFGSTRSYDLMTPIKPSMRPSGASDSHQQFPFAKATTQGLDGRKSLPNSPRMTALQTSPTWTSPLSLHDSANARHLHQQRHNLGESLGLRLDISPEARTAGTSTTLATIRGGRPAPPGLAGRLRISLPSSSTFNAPNAPQTPGGHIAVGARDGAADGGPPLSPFEPPTPLQAPADSPFRPSGSMSLSTASPVRRPELQQRHTMTPLRKESSGVLGMSPITSQFAAVSMRKTSSAKGSSTDSSMPQRCNTSDTSSNTSTMASTSTLLTPPYSPFTAPKSVPSELEVPLTASTERRASASSSASSTGSAKKRNDVVRSSVSSRPKSAKLTNKVSPYPLHRDDSPMKTATVAAEAPSSTFFAPARAKETPSLLTDLVKPPMAAPAMEKSVSEPVPKTVSARHLAHRTLHPTFTANYTLGDELGSGGFGFVVGATRDRDGMPVAVKFIWKDKVPSHGWVRDDEFGAIPMEAFVLKVVDSPFVVKFVDLFDDEQFFYLVMEHHGSPWKAPGADGKGTKASAGVDEGVAVDKLAEVALPTSTAMKSTKSQPNAAPLPSPTFAVFPPESDVAIVHDDLSSPQRPAKTSGSLTAPTPLRPVAMERRTSCDLFECIEQHSRLSEDKARWVFAQIVEAVYYLDRRGICHRDIKDENCVIDSDFNVKLIDFGSAVITDPRRPTPYFNRFFGTMTFASSEILQGKQYRAPHAEVWSLGVLLSILLSGECPFADPTAAIRGKISRPSSVWSAEALNLLMACLVVDPEKRATIAHIRQHPWVKKAWLHKERQPPSEPEIPYTRSTA